MSSINDSLESLSVIVPAYNAESCVATTLDDIQNWLAAHELPHEVIVVDDGSRDRTPDIVRQRGKGVTLLRNGVNSGKGFSVRRGMLASRCAWALFMDVDNSTAISHVEEFAPRAADADVIIASRRVPGSEIVTPRHGIRQILGRMTPYLVRTLALPDIHDTQCGFKMFRRNAVENIFPRQQVERFAFDVEVLMLARMYGHKIVEMPVRWDNPNESTLRVSVDTWQGLYDLARTVWRLRKGSLGATAAQSRG